MSNKIPESTARLLLIIKNTIGEQPVKTEYIGKNGEGRDTYRLVDDSAQFILLSINAEIEGLKRIGAWPL